MKVESKTVWTGQEATTEASISNASEQVNVVAQPDSQNVVDTLERYDRSEIFLRTAELFHLPEESNQLKDTAANFREGIVENPDGKSSDVLKLQDALQAESRTLSIDLPQELTDSRSKLGNTVMDALGGDAAAMQEVQDAFGFSQGPVQLYRKPDMGELSGIDGGTTDGGTDAGTATVEVEVGEITILDGMQDPDAIFNEPSGELTEAAKLKLVFGDRVDPDLQDVSAPQTSGVLIPGDGLTYTTPDVDDPSKIVGELKIPGPGGDPVDPDLREEPPGEPNIPSNDPYLNEV